MSLPDPYRPVRDFHAAVKDKPSWLSIVLGIVATEIVFTSTWYLLVDPLSANAGPTVSTLTYMFGFVFLGATAFWLASRFQGRSPATLFGPGLRAVGDGVRAARGVGIFYAVIMLLPPWDFSHYSLGMAPIAWVLLLPISLSAILIQVSAEELVYRGWLQQSLARISPSPALWMALPSVLFGLAHWSADLPTDAALGYVIWATFFGLACSDLTARTGTLGAAIGFHFMTNVLSIALFAVEEPFGGLALFTVPMSEARPEVNAVTLTFDLFYLWMSWMACRIAIRR